MFRVLVSVEVRHLKKYLRCYIENAKLWYCCGVADLSALQNYDEEPPISLQNVKKPSEEHFFL